MPFKKGHSGNPAGKKAGTLNKATVEIRDTSRRLLEDKAYVEAFRARLIAGKAPHMEPVLYYYAYGKPKETVDVLGLSEMAAALARKVVHELHPGPTRTP